MKIIIILVHLFATSLAIPLLTQRLLSASNSNEVLVGLVNPNLPQGSAMNMLVPRVLQNQLRQQIPGLSSFNGQFHPVLTPKLGTQSVLIDPVLQKAHQIQQQPNQIQYYPVYPSEQQPAPAIPKQSGPQPPIEQVFGCLVPQFTGEAINLERISPGGLQLPTKTPEDHMAFDGSPTLVPNNINDKVHPDNIKAP
ncbi:odontogenic ameloblast-associated protein [Pelodytes ibericus]